MHRFQAAFAVDLVYLFNHLPILEANSMQINFHQVIIIVASSFVAIDFTDRSVS